MILSNLLFAAVTIQLHLPPDLLKALCYVESKHKPAALNKHDGGSQSLGICQIKFATAKSMGFTGRPSDLMRPEVNILFAGKYLKHQLTRYKNHVEKAVVAYNQGYAREVTSTQYSKKVFKQWTFYKNQVRMCYKP
jgi:soluble lytic murein transglycosylase-like protein